MRWPLLPQLSYSYNSLFRNSLPCVIPGRDSSGKTWKLVTTQLCFEGPCRVQGPVPAPLGFWLGQDPDLLLLVWVLGLTSVSHSTPYSSPTASSGGGGNRSGPAVYPNVQFCQFRVQVSDCGPDWPPVSNPNMVSIRSHCWARPKSQTQTFITWFLNHIAIGVGRSQLLAVGTTLCITRC